MSIILGIDPGTTTVGYCLLKKGSGMPEILDFGVITTAPNLPLADKIRTIVEDLSGLLNEHSPEACGIETLLFTTNRKTGIAVAQARGAIVAEIAKRAIALYEF